MTSPDPAEPPAPATQRADKWLWQARFFKTRGLAARVVAAGHLRIDGARAAKPAQPVRPGVTLTFPQGRAVRIVKVVALANRRGPAAEAAALYDDLAPPGAGAQAASTSRQGRPDRDGRRAARAAKQGALEPGAPLKYVTHIQE